MNSLALETLESFCVQHGLSLPVAAERIRAGRNSEVSRLWNGAGQWILKHYVRRGADQRDRLGTEFGFLAFLCDAGVSGVPTPLGKDPELALGLYSFLAGRRPDVLTPAHISQAANFIGALDRSRASPGAPALPLAADACLSWNDHFDLVETRIRRSKDVRPDSDLARAARTFVLEQLEPLAARLKKPMLELGASVIARPLPLQDRIISPSDFGFHNALEENGSLCFVDFEYAGWDDPAKLICDFICQPELPVSDAQGEQFLNEVVRGLPQPDAIRHRAHSLLPLHRIKWCCILLNEFRIDDRQRRLHAAGSEPEALLAGQLAKAQRYFTTHLGSFN